MTTQKRLKKKTAYKDGLMLLIVVFIVVVVVTFVPMISRTYQVFMHGRNVPSVVLFDGKFLFYFFLRRESDEYVFSHMLVLLLKVYVTCVTLL